MANRPGIIALIGPTAAGKSGVAMELASNLGGEILSVDSMQVYRGMDIGTAKPSADEQRRVRHHAIDLVDPTETFTVARFVTCADEVIADARRRNIPLVAVGGTPLYYKALFIGMFDGPGADEAIRARLRDEPLELLHSRLVAVDPAAAERIHLNDRKRIVRALEVHEVTGQPISSLQNEWTDGKSRHEASWFGLSWDREILNRRVNARVNAMIDAGWVEETRELLKRFDSLSKTAAEATGYHEIIEHLAGRMPLADAVEQIKIATRQLARRQMKWLRRFKDVSWLAGDQSAPEIAKQIHDRLRIRYNS